MVKSIKNYSLYLLAIVSIVAVVGIVLMVSGGHHYGKLGCDKEKYFDKDTTEVGADAETSEDEALVGQARKILPAYNTCTPGEPTGKGKCSYDYIPPNCNPKTNCTLWQYKQELKDSKCKTYFEQKGEKCKWQGSYSCLPNVGCTPDCVDGDVIYVCRDEYYSAKYQKYTCVYDFVGSGAWTYEAVGAWSDDPTIYSTTCPPGATCYNNAGKCK